MLILIQDEYKGVDKYKGIDKHKDKHNHTEKHKDKDKGSDCCLTQKPIVGSSIDCNAYPRSRTEYFPAPEISLLISELCVFWWPTSDI